MIAVWAGRGSPPRAGGLPDLPGTGGEPPGLTPARAGGREPPRVAGPGGPTPPSAPRSAPRSGAAVSPPPAGSVAAVSLPPPEGVAGGAAAAARGTTCAWPAGVAAPSRGSPAAAPSPLPAAPSPCASAMAEAGAAPAAAALAPARTGWRSSSSSVRDGTGAASGGTRSPSVRPSACWTPVTASPASAAATRSRSAGSPSESPLAGWAAGCLPWPAAVAAAAAGGGAAPGAPARCCGCATTRAGCGWSAARSGALPAHSRSRLRSRAWEKYSAESTASPTTAAKPAYEPMSWMISSGKFRNFRSGPGPPAAGLVEVGARGRYRERSLCGKLGHRARERGAVAVVHELFNAREGALHPVGVERRPDRRHDLLGGGGVRPLTRVEQLLVHLLAGAPADHLHADVHVGLQARQADHVAGEVDDLHRVAHLEHEHLAPG